MFLSIGKLRMKIRWHTYIALYWAEKGFCEGGRRLG